MVKYDRVTFFNAVALRAIKNINAFTQKEKKKIINICMLVFSLDHDNGLAMWVMLPSDNWFSLFW